MTSMELPAYHIFGDLDGDYDLVCIRQQCIPIREQAHLDTQDLRELGVSKIMWAGHLGLAIFVCLDIIPAIYYDWILDVQDVLGFVSGQEWDLVQRDPDVVVLRWKVFVWRNCVQPMANLTIWDQTL